MTLLLKSHMGGFFSSQKKKWGRKKAQIKIGCRKQGFYIWLQRLEQLLAISKSERDGEKEVMVGRETTQKPGDNWKEKAGFFH